ncbi:MAG: CPBP family intramembrane metalloprotease [Gammaproteobacteria bacterium]|mgnify:FL=1|jgi:hypothetical protein|nr:CPBP family intramembrane metalloprotease [Gammaproteobacteria bacterium]MBT3858484.1 CPBP family intramembrane metalloprotease [Gammaproteobacteria bacterium]MBT3986778.1 CPBP family intramembrane metalloprotease [Gammaproteobacteria bacterium]MBT4254716.1 CPBP family intramembrane metalloprotease [Gammaproteobacteria bacterium]MBT4582874.1 CPBP family intramembrane metalloprotease [Gammaproteobacteria bacterium]
MIFGLITAAIALYFPISQYLTFGKTRARLIENPALKLGFYRETIVYLWAITSCLALALWINDVPLADLGLAISLDTPFLFVAGLLCLASVLLFRRKPVDDESYEKHQLAYDHVRYILPDDEKQHRWMQATSFTAGITEEFIFRAYMLWYFNQHMDMVFSIILLNFLFCLCHVWSGPKNMFGSFVLGLFFSLIYFLSGSILLAMLAHVLTDLYAGRIGFGLAEFERSRMRPELANSIEC